MKNVLVDTSVWINFFNTRNHSKEANILQELIEKNNTIYICPIIYQEILQGIRDDKTFEEIKNILLDFPIIDIKILTVTDLSVDIYRGLRKKGITIRKPVDCLIASYAILGDMILLHKDRDFDQIATGTKLKIYK